MQVWMISDGGIEPRPVGELGVLLARDDGIVWVDIPACDPEVVHVLAEEFRFHPLAIRDCVERNRVPRVHAYPDHVLLILHAPEHGKAGHVHYVELDQFIGQRYLVTVHGPVNPAVRPEVPLRETNAVLKRIQAGKLRPSSPFELSYAIVSSIARRQETFIEELTQQVWELEQTVTGGDIDSPEDFLEDLFRARHGLLAVRTMAALGGEVHGRMISLGRFVSPQERPLLEDVVDQFERVRGLADGEKEYLQGVIEFYQTRTGTKMAIAAERLTVIAVITLPITALSSIYGMNIIVNQRTDFPHLAVVLGVMLLISGVLLRWARRQGWW
jgi:magnesium transporter